MSRPRTDWRTLPPALHTALADDSPAWVSARSRQAAEGLLAALTADVERAIDEAGTVAAAESVTGLSASEVSRWRRRGVLSKAGRAVEGGE